MSAHESMPAGESRPLPPAPGPDVWDVLARWRAERRRFVRVSVVHAHGFTPQKGGAHMLVDEHGATAGTVGGGAIEAEALAAAHRMLQHAPAGASELLKRHLTQELGMCCGGEMTLHLERMEPAPRLVVFGAGYIARPLVAMARTCGFETTVVDARGEWLTPARFPGATLVLRDPEHAFGELALSPRDFVVVVTHDHALDQRLIQALLARPPAFLGMVGSVAKQRKFALRLKARGFDDAAIARMRTPLGLAIGAATPEEIAVSIMGELIAARRGRPLPPVWLPPARGGRADAPDPDAGNDAGAGALPPQAREIVSR
ncbi:MAG TPA: xanthine dehydrogenase accessory protein XdhC [Candidatus Eisenbacteria bacterium]|nr:xanthine dehydrogenase accessory protein XdhC [Candidatus Eisenbacteria bacterium]